MVKEALNITFTGLMVVFLGLTILFLIFLFMSKVLAGREEKLEFESEPKIGKRETPRMVKVGEEDLKMEAIISAVLFAMLEGERMGSRILRRGKCLWGTKGWRILDRGWKKSAGIITWRRGVGRWSENSE